MVERGRGGGEGGVGGTFWMISSFSRLPTADGCNSSEALSLLRLPSNEMTLTTRTTLMRRRMRPTRVPVSSDCVTPASEFSCDLRRAAWANFSVESSKAGITSQAIVAVAIRSRTKKKPGPRHLPKNSTEK